MKRLNITNFTIRMMEIYSDFFEVKYCTEWPDKYIMSLDIRDVISFTPIGSKHYKMSIEKGPNEDGNYGIWLWDVDGNISYPMSIGMDSLKSLSVFTSYLNHTLKLASEGIFEGEKGNRIK
jgi:hypothetical protein